MNSPQLCNVAFIGKAGSGKDTAAELLIEQLGYRRVAFADKLKLAYPGAPNYKGPGAGVLRYIEGGEEHPVVVTDCRYHNEAWALKGDGFVIVRIVADRNERINRLRTNGKLDEWPEDYRVINLGTKADLLDELARTIALESR